ncbi:hypothetical protein DKP78_20570, partial [Enterococcus faecium]
ARHGRAADRRGAAADRDRGRVPPRSGGAAHGRAVRALRAGAAALSRRPRGVAARLFRGGAPGADRGAGGRVRASRRRVAARCELFDR